MKTRLLLLRGNVFSKDRYYLIAILLNGFLTGLVFSLIAIAIPNYQLAEAQYSVGEIGILALATYPYSLKILWAPLVDRYSVPFLCAKLGLRRGWAMTAQICLLLALLSLNLLDMGTTQSFPILAIACIIFIISFFAATQDMVWEAYRIERPATKEELPLAIASSTTGFRLGMFIGSVVSLDIAARYGWYQVYQIVFLLTLIGPITILCIKEPTPKATDTLQTKHNYLHIIYKSFMALKEKQSYFLLFLFFLLLYKSNDIVPMTMGQHLAYSLSFHTADVALSKKIGYIGMIVGIALGGMLTTKVGIFRSIWIAGIMQLLAPFMLMLLALVGHDMLLFIIATAVQHFVSGLATTALTIYLASLCNGQWKVTQYTIIASIGANLRILLSTASGLVAARLSWPKFFFSTMLLGILAIVIFPVIYRKNDS